MKKKKPILKLRPVYILWNPDSELPPRVRFSTPKAATDAAQVMARRYPGNVFHVCRVLDGVRAIAPVPPIEWVEP